MRLFVEASNCAMLVTRGSKYKLGNGNICLFFLIALFYSCGNSGIRFADSFQRWPLRNHVPSGNRGTVTPWLKDIFPRHAPVEGMLQARKRTTTSDFDRRSRSVTKKNKSAKDRGRRGNQPLPTQSALIGTSKWLRSKKGSISSRHSAVNQKKSSGGQHVTTVGAAMKASSGINNSSPPMVIVSNDQFIEGRVNYTDLIQRRKPLHDVHSTFRSLVPGGENLVKMDKRQFAQELMKTIPTLSSSTLGDVLLNLSNLKLPTRSKDMVLLSDILVERLNSVQRSINARDFTHCMVGLARLGIRCPNPAMPRISQYSHVYNSRIKSNGLDRASFYSALPRVLPQMDASEVSSTLWAMGKVGATWDALPLKVQKAVGAAVVRTNSTMTPLCVANTIHGLSNMKAQWQALPRYLSTALRTSLKRTISEMGEQETSNCLSGLGKLGANWQTLPKSVRTSLGQRFLDNLDNLGPKGLAMSVDGLGRMNTEIRYLPSTFRDSIMTAIVRIIPRVNAQEVSKILNGLGRMGADFTGQRDKRVTISGPARRGLMKALTLEAWRMNANGISNSLWGLMHMHARWRMFTSAEQDALLLALCREAPRMDEHELGNTLFSLGHLGLSWRNKMGQETRNILLTALEEVGALTTPNGVVMTLMGLGKLHLTWHSLPQSLKTCLGDALEHVLRHASERTLFSIVQALHFVKAQWVELRPSIQTTLQESIARTYWTSGTESYCNKTESMVNAGFGLLYDSEKGNSSSANKSKYTFSNRPSSPEISSIEHVDQLKYQELHIQKAMKADDISNTTDADSSRFSATALEQLPSSTAAALLLQQPSTNETSYNGTNDAQRISLSSVAQSPAVSLSAKNPMLIRGKQLFSGKNQFLSKDLKVAASGLNRSVGANSANSTVDRKVLPANTFAASHGHYVYYLGQMHVRWEELGISAQIAISASLEKALPSMTEQGVVNSLHGLSTMGCNWHLLNPSLKEMLITALSRVSSKMQEQGVSVTVLSLAKMEACWGDDLTDELKNGLRAAIVRQAELSEHALSNLLYGLGRMGRPWNEIHPEVRHTLTEAVMMCHLHDKCSPQGVANNLYGLAHMHVAWADLSSSVRLSLLKEMMKVLPRATSSQLSSMLGSLGKMGASWNGETLHLPADLRALIWKHLLMKCPTMNEQHVSNVLFALGGMGVEWQQLPNDVMIALSKRLSVLCSRASVSRSRRYRSNNDVPPPPAFVQNMQETRRPKMLSEQGLSMTMVGLSKLKTTWMMLPPSTAAALEQRTLDLIDDMNSAQLSCTLSSMASMKRRWDDMKDELKRSIIASVTKTILRGNGNFHDVSLAVLALGNLGARWQGIQRKSVSFEKSFYRTIHHLVGKGNHEQFAGLVLGIAMMDQRWEDIPSRYRKDIRQGALRLFKPTSSPVVPLLEQRGTPQSSLYREEKSFSPNNGRQMIQELTNDVYGTFMRMTKPQSIANLVYGFSLLVFDVENRKLCKELAPVHAALLDAISKMGVSQFNEAEKEQILIYTHLLQTVLPDVQDCSWSALSPTHILRADRPLVQSKLQESVVRSLKEALQQHNQNLKVADEYSAFNGAFPIDATVFNSGSPVAFVEVDGPQHFHDGVLRRKDMMKEVLYRMKHPCATFARVRFDQVDNLGPYFVGRQIAELIVLRLRSVQTEGDVVSDPCSS